MKQFLLLSFSLAAVLSACTPTATVGTRVFVVERAGGKLAVIDYAKMELITKIQTSAGDMRHASMVFDPALRYGYVALRNGVLSRIDLARLKEAGSLQTSKNSIGIAISRDARTVAVAEYDPGGVTIVDLESFKIAKSIPAKTTFEGKEIVSRVTGMSDGASDTFLCGLMDGNEIWILAPGKEGGPASYELKHRVSTPVPHPFDAIITPDGRYYITAHINSARSSLVDVRSDHPSVRVLDYRGSAPGVVPPKMPHMASWAVAGDKIFMPVVGEHRIAVLSQKDFSRISSIDLLGFPVYSVVSPDGTELWVTFTGDDHDGDIQILDTESGRTKKIIKAGKKI
ncbi:MAG: hypothetical protein HY042_03095, partial [Spirochaetia bacterium]|nr:hypothetical protein [Spirochaetia bacterium]